MRRIGLFLPGLLALAALLPGCQKPAPPSASAFQLRTVTLKVGGQPLTAEVADTPATMQIGLMYRTAMPEDHGMIFVFPEPRQASFWMHNTPLPLDIAYLDRSGTVLEIHAAAPNSDARIPSQTNTIAYALETNQGWFARKGLKAGAVVENLPRPGRD